MSWFICFAAFAAGFIVRGVLQLLVNSINQSEIEPPVIVQATPPGPVALWQRALMLQDQRMAILEQACELYGVDPDVDTHERCFLEMCYLNPCKDYRPEEAERDINRARARF
jgi:hypothetical protein